MPFDYQDNYHRELEHRNQLRAAVGTPIVVLTVVGSLVGFMVQKHQFVPEPTSIVFSALVCAAIAGVGAAAFFLARAIHGHTYKHIECAMRLRQYHEDLRAWHLKTGSNREAADREFDDYLEESYALAGDHNARLNASRSASVFCAHRAMIFAAILAGAAFLPFAYRLQVDDKEPILVRLTESSHQPANQEKSTMTEEQNPPRQEPAAPPKPERPPLRDVREDHQPRKKK